MMRISEFAFGKTLEGRRLWAVVVDADTDGEGSAAPVIDALRRTAELATAEHYFDAR